MGNIISLKTEKQIRTFMRTYSLLHRVSKTYKVDNVTTWLLVVGLAETYQFVERPIGERILRRSKANDQ